jgi:hypothetical protein
MKKILMVSMFMLSLVVIGYSEVSMPASNAAQSVPNNVVVDNTKQNLDTVAKLNLLKQDLSSKEGVTITENKDNLVISMDSALLFYKNSN